MVQDSTHCAPDCSVTLSVQVDNRIYPKEPVERLRTLSAEIITSLDEILCDFFRLRKKHHFDFL
jgi:hypothetical protein